MEIVSAVILGIVQGLTEFLPVSSTAHLVLVPWLFGWDDPLLNSLSFDVALHLGTLIAVLIYFRRDWLQLLGALFTSISKRRVETPYERLIWLLIIATIPAGVLGALFEHKVESAFRGPLLIASALAAVAVLMLLAEGAARKMRGRPLEEMTLGRAIVIGCAQAVALVPGVSRSGATITAGIWTGYDRESAARFSFLLSTPVIAGACVLKLRHLFAGLTGGEEKAIAFGVAASAISGYLAIAFLIGYLKRRPLNLFAYYRLVAAAGIAAVWFLR